MASLTEQQVRFVREALNAARICLKNRDQSPLEVQALEKVKAAMAWLDGLPGSGGNRAG